MSTFDNFCSDLTIVVQGPWHINLCQSLLQLKRLFPGSQIIWSSFLNDKTYEVPDFVKRVHTTDPGALDRSDYGGRTNCSMRRQVANFAAGLKIANRKYLLKIRSDLYIFDRSIVLLFLECKSKNADFFVVNSESTHKPSVLFPSYCHFGDWVFIGNRRSFDPILSIDVNELRDVEIGEMNYFERFRRSVSRIGNQTTSCEMEIWKPVLKHCMPNLVILKNPLKFQTK